MATAVGKKMIGNERRVCKDISHLNKSLFAILCERDIVQLTGWRAAKNAKQQKTQEYFCTAFSA
jgi:hypothetical protein